MNNSNFLLYFFIFLLCLHASILSMDAYKQRKKEREDTFKSNLEIYGCKEIDFINDINCIRNNLTHIIHHNDNYNINEILGYIERKYNSKINFICTKNYLNNQQMIDNYNKSDTKLRFEVMHKLKKIEPTDCQEVIKNISKLKNKYFLGSNKVDFLSENLEKSKNYITWLFKNINGIIFDSLFSSIINFIHTKNFDGNFLEGLELNFLILKQVKYENICFISLNYTNSIFAWIFDEIEEFGSNFVQEFDIFFSHNIALWENSILKRSYIISKNYNYCLLSTANPEFKKIFIKFFNLYKKSTDYINILNKICPRDFKMHDVEDKTQLFERRMLKEFYLSRRYSGEKTKAVNFKILDIIEDKLKYIFGDIFSLENKFKQPIIQNLLIEKGITIKYNEILSKIKFIYMQINPLFSAIKAKIIEIKSIFGNSREKIIRHTISKNNMISEHFKIEFISVLKNIDFLNILIIDFFFEMTKKINQKKGRDTTVNLGSTFSAHKNLFYEKLKYKKYVICWNIEVILNIHQKNYEEICKMLKYKHQRILSKNILILIQKVKSSETPYLHMISLLCKEILSMRKKILYKDNFLPKELLSNVKNKLIDCKSILLIRNSIIIEKMSNDIKKIIRFYKDDEIKFLDKLNMILDNIY